MDRGAGALRQIEQGQVEVGAMDRPDHLAVVAAIGLQLLAAFEEVDHAPAHHHRAGHHRVFGIGLAQRMAAAFGQGQVDRAARFVALDARVAAALVDGDLPALAREQDGQQRAGQAGADDRDGARGCVQMEFFGGNGRGKACSDAGPHLHFFHQAIDVLEAVVQRHRRDADHVRFAPVTEHADLGQVVEQPAAALAPAGHAQ